MLVPRFCDFCTKFPFEAVGQEVPLETFFITERYRDSQSFADIDDAEGCARCNAVKRALYLNTPHKLKSKRPIEAFYTISIPKYPGVPPELVVDLKHLKAHSYRRLLRNELPLGIYPDEDLESIEVTETFRRTFPTLPVATDDIHANWGCTPTGCLREVGPNLDFEMLRFWDRMCTENAHSCRTSLHVTGFNKSDLKVRLIDVDNQCLVHASLEEPFLALSYVWGSKSQIGLHLSSIRGNVAQLEKPGSLDHDDYLPAAETVALTIRNAMDVTREMGYRLLFVDRLCIDQDDEDEIAFYTNSMDQIFGSAAITIVASAGDSAHSGLPGVSGTPRRVEPRPSIELQDGTTLKRFYEYEKRPETLLEGALVSSVWMTRAWTFQERLLSLRLLIFTSEGAFWSCPRGRYSEAVAYERRSIATSLDTTAGVLSPDEEYLTLSESEQVLSNSKRLTGLVNAYKRRNLTFPRDALRAFQGILTAFSTVNDPWPFHFGLSSRALPIELAWGVPSEGPMRSLRSGATNDKSLGNNRDPISDRFPSWSWLAAKGEEVFWERELHLANSSFLNSATAMTTSMHKITSESSLEEIYVESRPVFQLFPGQQILTIDRLLSSLSTSLVSDPVLSSKAIVFGGFPIPCSILNASVESAQPGLRLHHSSKESLDLLETVGWHQYPRIEADSPGIAIIPLGQSPPLNDSHRGRSSGRFHCILVKTIDGVSYRIGKFTCQANVFRKALSFAAFKPIVLC